MTQVSTGGRKNKAIYLPEYFFPKNKTKEKAIINLVNTKNHITTSMLVVA